MHAQHTSARIGASAVCIVHLSAHTHNRRWEWSKAPARHGRQFHSQTTWGPRPLARPAFRNFLFGRASDRPLQASSDNSPSPGPSPPKSELLNSPAQQILIGHPASPLTQNSLPQIPPCPHSATACSKSPPRTPPRFLSRALQQLALATPHHPSTPYYLIIFIFTLP